MPCRRAPALFGGQLHRNSQPGDASLLARGQHFGDRVYRTRIPRNVRLSEAPSHGKPILLYDIHSRGALAYLQLAEEILARRARELATPPPLAAAPAEVVEDIDDRTP